MDYRTVRAKARRPTERQRKAAANLAAGMTIKSAMLEAGYSRATSIAGMQAVPATVQALTLEQHPLVIKGRAASYQGMRNLVLGRLIENCEKGQDKGVLSSKALGSIKELNMFQSEQQQGLVVLNLQVPNTGEVPDKEE
jgi:hypothetical protein